jgi:hypothetical protein
MISGDNSLDAAATALKNNIGGCRRTYSEKQD